jgi:hypothetical protein
VWAALTDAVGALVGLFHSGPFAWNGLISFYVAGAGFFGWYVAVFIALRRATGADRFMDHAQALAR